MSLWCQKLGVMGSICHSGDILSFALARFGGITNGEYRKMFGISDRTALRDLTAICEKGIFQKVGVTRRETKYIQTRHKPGIFVNKYEV